MEMNIKSEQTAAVERRFSRRLAKKRKNSTESEKSEKHQNPADAPEVPETGQSSSQKDESKELKSKSLFDCLELQPVEPDSSKEAADTQCNNSDTQSEVKVDVSEPSNSTKCKKEVKKRIKASKKRVQKVDTTEDIENNYTPLSDTVKQGMLLRDSGSTSDLNVSPLKSSNQDIVVNDALDGKSKVTGKEGELNNQIYIFRDVNKIANKVYQDESSTDLFVTVDLNRHGKKRRYDKLIKKLVDSEKNLEINLKEVKHEDIMKADISLCVEKMKEKLRVREKKKYEYLINYMRDQWRVDQKSFQDLLPQKVDLVKENVVRQLGANNDKVVAEKRKRGRPRKVDMTGEKVIDSLNDKKPKAKQNRQNSCQKKKDSTTNKGFPVKFPKSLLSDSNSSQNRHRVETFRVGIVDKNGSQEFIELNSETFHNGSSVNTIDALLSTTISDDKHESKNDNTSCQAVQTRDGKKCIELGEIINTEGLKEKAGIQATSASSLNSGDSGVTSGPHCNKVAEELTLEVMDKYRPTTISLPSVSSLERDYELVSLSPPYPPQLGNFHSDHFFIPQSTFDQDGKTSMIIVGPFCLVCDPKPRLLLVSPDERKKGPTMILRKKIHSPSSTPPRDFRIHKESRCVRMPFKSAAGNVGGQQGDPAIILLDHNYMTPPELRDNVKRYCKAVAKHSANVKFIDARVEKITEEEDNFVVTIKGDNMLHQVKNLANSSQAPMSCNKDGMPIVYNLSQIMTTALIEADLAAKREKLVLESQQTGDYTPVMFPFSAMGDVVMEVLIPPGGTELLPRSRNRHLQMSKESSGSVTTVSQPVRPVTSSNCRESISLHQEGDIDLENSSGREDEHETRSEGVNQDEQQVVIENADAVDGGPLPGLPCCRMCLHLFPSDYLLFTHVRSNHPTYDATDSVYLEELRARSHLVCPICCNPPAFLPTPAKLKRHLRVIHGIDHYIEICRFCQAEFVDKHELEVHTELSHNTFAGRRLVSLLKPQRSSHILRRQRSLLSDYLSCSRCNIVFSDRVSLWSHTLKVHPELNQFNMCRLCDRLFDSAVSLHKHLKKVHEQTHDGALKCPFCPAWLSSVELASIHRITLHTGAVPVHCPFCGAGYQNLHLMYNHVRSQHLQTEVHICPQCQSSFPTGRLLSEHMRKAHVMSPRIMKDNSHSACNMSYCCPFCTMSFMHTYDLAIHVINAHKEHLLPSQCHMCMQAFVSDVIMKAHMSGAHGIDTSPDNSYVHGHFGDAESVTVVLQDDGGDMYTHTKDLDANSHGRTLMRGHLMDAQDMLDSQEADQYIDLDDQETIVYLSDRTHIVSSDEMFGNCSTLGDVQLLGEANDDFHLHGVDYLETLTNDSIAVGADVVADVSMDDMSSSGVGEGELGDGHQDLLGMTSQFEIDGVLYELAASHDGSDQLLEEVEDMTRIDASDLRLSCDTIRVDASDLAHLLRQQVQ